MRSVEFLLGLLDDTGVAGVDAEDLAGPHAAVLRAWQELGVVATDPGMHPTPSCPHCGEGVPYRLGERSVCPLCHSTVPPDAHLLWPLDRAAFAAALARHLGLAGGVRPVDDALWQLGTGTAEGTPLECFWRCRGRLSEPAVRRLAAYRRTVVLYGPSASLEEHWWGQWVSVIALFAADGFLRPMDLAALLRPRGAVRFDELSGALWAGGTWLGEVPAGSREHCLLGRLAAELDHFVSYADLKREVLRRSGGTDGTDEATFCHGLKRRIKKKWMPKIDQLIVTTNKADGYRLKAHLPGEQ